MWPRTAGWRTFATGFNWPSMTGDTLLRFRNIPIIVYCIYLFTWWHCTWLNYGAQLLDDSEQYDLEVVVDDRGVSLEISKEPRKTSVRVVYGLWGSNLAPLEYKSVLESSTEPRKTSVRVVYGLWGSNLAPLEYKSVRFWLSGLVLST
jgi:hypothetical protein